jgi:hypothetical protein
MFYPQGNFHSQGIGFPQQGIGFPQGVGLPQGLGYPQAVGYPQGFGYPQGLGYPQGGFGQQGFPATSNIIPFSNTLYGYPQLTPSFHLQGSHALGLANGASQTSGLWQQPQASPEQINPGLLPQSPQQLLQRLAQYHQFVAQQLAQMAAQQPTQGPGNPYTGQFVPSQFVPSGGQYIPGQIGASFVPGITMH